MAKKKVEFNDFTDASSNVKRKETAERKGGSSYTRKEEEERNTQTSSRNRYGYGVGFEHENYLTRDTASPYTPYQYGRSNTSNTANTSTSNNTQNEATKQKKDISKTVTGTNRYRNATADDLGQALNSYLDWNRAINDASERNDAIGLGNLKKGAYSMAQYFADNAGTLDETFGHGTARDLLNDMARSTDFIDANMQYLNGTTPKQEDPIDYANRSTAESVEDYMRALANGEEGGGKVLGGIAASLGAVAANAVSALSLPAILLDSQFRNRKSAEELNNASFLERMFPGELDRDAWYMIAPRAAQAAIDTVSQNIENRERSHLFDNSITPTTGMADNMLNKVDAFLYQTGMSMVNFIAQGVLASATVEGLGMATEAMAYATATGDTVLASQLQQELVENVSLSIMGSGAMAQSVNECLEKGMSTDETMTLSIIAGAAEVLTEKVSIDALLDTETLAGNVSKYIQNNMLSEGSEEVASDFINLVADIAVRGKDSDAYQKINTSYNMLRDAYIEAGMSVEEAETTALSEAVWQSAMEQVGSSAMSFIGGALSGGVMAGANAARYNNATAQLGQQIVDEGRGSVERLVNEGLNADTQSNVYKMAQQLQNELNSQEEVDVEAVGDLYNAVQEYQEGRQETVTEIGNAVTELEENGMVSNSTVNSLMHNNDAVEMLTSYTDVEITGNRSQRQEAVRKALAEFSTRMNEENAETDTAAETENAPVNQNISEQNIADEEVISNNTAIENNPVNQSISTENAHQNITQEEVIENEGTERAEEEQNSRADGQRNDTLVDRGRGEGIQVLNQSKAERYQQQRITANELRNSLDVRRVSTQSAVSAGIAGASEISQVRIVPEDAYNTRLQNIQKVCSDNGVKVVFFAGDNFNIKNGGSARGYCSSNGDTIYVRADHPKYSAEQLARHELFHSTVRTNPALVSNIVEQIKKNYDSAKLADIVSAYTRAYKSWQNTKTAEEIYEEILADAYAGMNVFEGILEGYRGADAISEVVKNNTATGNEVTETSAKFSTEFSDVSLEKNYNDFGWADDGEILSHEEYGAWGRELENLKKHPKSKRDGSYIIQVDGDNVLDTVFIYTSGTYEDPVIERVLRLFITEDFDGTLQSEFDRLGRLVYAAERKYSNAFETIGKYYDEGLFRTDIRENRRPYSEYRQEQEGRTHEEADNYGGRNARERGSEGNWSYSEELSDDIKSLQKTNRELNRLLDKTRIQLENARKQTKITSEANKWTVRYEDAKRSAIALKNSFENAKLTIPTKRVADMQKNLADLYMQTDITKEELNKKAIEYAKEIIDSAEIFHDPDAMDFASKVKNEIGRGIYISAKDKAQITDYGDFKKNHPGLKMSTANAELQTLDELWSSLAESFPGEFDAELTGASERLTALYEVLDDYQTRYLSFDTAYAIETTAQSMLISAMDDSMRLVAPTYADTQAEKFDRAMERARDSKNKALADQRERYNDKIADLKDDKQEALTELRTEKNQKLADLREELTAKADEALAREKNRRVEEIQELKDKQRAKDKKRIEERQKREAREKLEKHVKKLSSDLLSNTKEHHVPEVYRNAVAEALSLINLSSNYKEIYQNKRYPKKGVRFETTRVSFLDENGNKNKYFDVLGFETKKTQAFNALKEQYQAIANRTVADDGLYIELEGKLVEGDLVSAVRELAGTPVSAMTLEQITKVSDFVTAIEASIKNYNRMLSESNYAMAGDFAYALYKNNEWKNEKKIGGVVGDFATLDTLTPEAYFYRLGDAGREMFRMMRYSQDKYIKLIEEASEFTHKIEKDFGVDRSKLDKDMRTVKLGGREYQISASQIMALYALSQREQGLQHILQGGIKVLDLNKKNAFKQTYARVIRGITIEQLNNTFSDQNVLHLNERQAADTLQNYMSTTLADWGNEASMTVYGYKKFTEGKYFPIRVNSEELMKDPSAKERLSYTVANRGFTKDLSKFANQSVYIGSFFDEMSGHTSEMATYSAWLATMEDLRRIRQYKFMEEFTGSFESVSDILAHVHGTGGSAYFDNLMRDLANGVHSEKAYFGGAVGNWKAAAVGANLRVILQQPTAVLRAADMIGAKYMTKAFNPLDLMKAYDEAKKYCPIAVWKDWGYFDLNTGKSIRDILFDSKNSTDKAREAFMKPAGTADSIAWGYLWRACKAEIADKTDLKVGSEEYFKEVADRFNEVIDHTQVVDGVLQRSQVMRNGNGIVKMAASFMAEPTKQVNMFMSSAYDVQHAESKTAKKTAWKQFARTTSSLLVAGVVNAVVQSLVDGLRHNDPDDDKSYWEEVLASFIGFTKKDTGDMTAWDFIKSFFTSNLGDIFVPASYFVYAKDVWSLLQGYDIERTDMAGIADLIQSVDYFTKALSGNGSRSTANALLNLIGKASSVFGVPIYNIKRDLFAVLNNIAASMPPLYRYYNAKFQYKVNGDKNRFIGILYDAYKTDPEAYKIIYDKLISDGLDDDTIKNRMHNLMKKEEGVTSVEDLTSRWYSPQQQETHDELAEPITSNRLWDAATDDMRDKVDGYMYDLALENTDGVKLSEKLEDAGVDTSTYLLYNLALSVYDEPNKNGNLGTYTNDEKESAIDELHLSRELASALWMLAGGTDKNNPYK